MLKRTIEEMRKKLIEVNEEKNNFELMTMTYKEEIKYIKRDRNEMSKSIERIKIDRQNVINEIKQQKNKIFAITKGAGLSDSFMKKITQLLKTEEQYTE